MTPRPVSVTVHAVASSPQQQTFAAVVPIDLTLIFKRLGPLPAVIGTRDQSGSWDRVGRTRRVILSDGTSASEQITAYEPPSYFEYEVGGFTNVLRRLVSGARGYWRFTPASDGGTYIAWTYSFRPLRFRAAAVRVLVATLWRLYMRRALAATVREVEREDRGT